MGAVAKGMTQWVQEVLTEIARKISIEERVPYQALLTVILDEYGEICQEVAENAKKGLHIIGAMMRLFITFALLGAIVGRKYGSMATVSFLISAILVVFLSYFSALLFPFFRKLAKKHSLSTTSSVSTILFSFQSYLFRGRLITAMFTYIIGNLIAFWIANTLLSLTGLGYLGIYPAILYGIIMGLSQIVAEYAIGKKNYKRIKGAIIKRFSQP